MTARWMVLALMLWPGLAWAEAPANPQAPPAVAGEGDPAVVKQPRATARLVTDRATITPGEAIAVGVAFDLEPGWHIYWKDPGDTGQPTEITFGAPDGFDFGEIQWPAPHIFTSPAGTDYGYEGKVLLFTEVGVPEGLTEGETVSLTADTEWLVCKETCIPGKARLRLDRRVQTTAHGANAPTTPDAPAFRAARADLPVAVPEWLEVQQIVSRSAVRPGEPFEVVLALRATDGAALSDLSVALAAAPGLRVVRTSLGEAAPKSLAGAELVRIQARSGSEAGKTGDAFDAVLGVTRDGQPHRVALRVPVPRAPAGAQTLPTESPLFAAAPAPLAKPAPPPEPTPAVATPPAPSPAEPSFALMLLFAFIGGLILNVMPCVLPVLSIKVLGLVQQAGDDRRTMMNHGLAYTAGILLSFGALAAAIVALQAAGRFSGWGFQFQSPAFVAALGAVVFAFGLSLFGVFELSMPGSSKLSQIAGRRHGLSSSLLNGVFATVLATPCTAPFLSPALAFALSQPPVTLVTMLLTVGFGLAFPFLLLAVFPSWSRWLPKPGPWMETFKKAMGFLLVATTLWLVNILARQVSVDALIGYLVFLTAVSLASWIYGHWGSPIRAAGTRWSASLVAAAVIGASAATFISTERPRPAVAGPAEPTALASAAGVAWPDPDEIPWRDFFAVDVEAAATGGQTVFIDFTAEWCVTCKANEKTVIDTDPVRAVLRDLGVVPVKADWTSEDDRITAWLQRFKRPGVPMYVILPAGRPQDPILLPELLTESSLVEGLRKAGPSQPPSSASL